jgi:hypothetical protein
MKRYGLILFILSWEFFFHESDSKINTTPMEDTGHDACVIVGYYNKVTDFILNVQYFSKWNTVGNVAQPT